MEKEKAVNNRRLELIQGNMEKMMAQQEANNKVLEEMKNRPVSELTRQVQTAGPAQPAYACPNCIPRRLPPDMQDPTFR